MDRYDMTLLPPTAGTVARIVLGNPENATQVACQMHARGVTVEFDRDLDGETVGFRLERAPEEDFVVIEHPEGRFRLTLGELVELVVLDNMATEALTAAARRALGGGDDA